MKDNSIPTDSHPWVQGKIQEIFQEVSKVIVGQQYLVERLLMGLLADGHILIEGVPGLAKTTSVKTLAEIIDASFQRIQFTPDLLPADILGTQIYNPKMRKIIRQTYLDPKINEYIIRIVFATREPKDLRLDLERYLRYGASPRASISLNMVCKAYAFIQGRDYVVPQDVKIMALDVLRHRIILTFEAEAEGLSTDDILKKILRSE